MKNKIVVLMMLMVLSLSTLSFAGTEFKDVPSSHWAFSYINTLKSSMIISGYPDGTFRPQTNVKINEFITMTVKALGYSVEPNTADWSKPYIDKAIELGIIKNDEFPSYTANINREQMTSIAVGAILLSESLPVADLNKYVQEETTDFYKVSDDYFNKVIYGYRLGVITGFTDHSFKPQDHSTRAQASTVISKIINKNLRTPFVRTSEPYTVVSTLVVDEFGNEMTMPIAMYAPKFNGKSVTEIINVVNILKKSYPTGYFTQGFDPNTQNFSSTGFKSVDIYINVFSQLSQMEILNALIENVDMSVYIKSNDLTSKFRPYTISFSKESINYGVNPKYSTYIEATYGKQLKELFEYLFEKEFDIAWNLLIEALDSTADAKQEIYSINGRTVSVVSGSNICLFDFTIKK